MVVFECDAGYTLSGSAETQCQDDGRWDPPVPTCERTVQCVSPPAIANGKPSGQALAVFTSGMSVNYSCEPGYSVTGQASIYCTASGTWSSPPPRCEEVLCIAPAIQNGRKVAGRGPVYRPRDTVRFECDPGYTLSGSRQIQCRDEGTWDPPVPVCTQVLLCPPPPVIVKGKHNAKPLAAFPSGTYANYSCEPGYTLRGEASIYCTTSGTWSHPSPLCEEVLCIAPAIQNGRKVAGHGPVYRPRDTVRFECDPGYTLNGSRQIQCRDEGIWDPPVPACTQTTCVSPEVEHGRTNGVQRAYRPRDMVVFECDAGYTLSGSPETQCQDDGRWDPPVPTCERKVLCIAPEIQNGRKVAGRGAVYRPRDTVRFECDPGYTLSGSRLIQCQDDGNWDSPVPACTQVLLCPPPPVIVKGKHNAKPLAAFPSGTYVNYSCEPGYALRGEASIYCTTSGTWSHPSPLCEV
nr:complement receptor type 2 [Caretta caretta]